MIAANATGVEELAIDEAEGKQFMLSAQNVMRHYSIESSQKTIDWIAFGGTCCMIYGTRFGAYMLRKRAEKQNVRPMATVYPMPARPSPTPDRTINQPAQQPPAQQPVSDHIMPEMDFVSDGE